jgi:hypothetical protein
MDFSLKAVFGIDAKGFKSELRQLRSEVGSFASSIAKLGAGATVGMFVALSKSAIDLGSKLSDTAAQVGINVEALQVLNSLARDAGVSQETLAKALVKTRTSAQEAAEGNKTYAEAFAALGMDVEKFMGMPQEQKLEAIGRAYAASGDKAAAYNALTTIFGEKAGPKMMEVLGTLADKGFPAVAAAAQKNGELMSGETIAALDRAGDAIEAFKQRAAVAVGNIIVNFRTEEGILLLGMQLLETAHKFMGSIMDAVTYPARAAGAVFGAAFEGVVDLFRNGLVDAIQGAAGLLNKVLPESLKIDVQGLESLKAAGDSIGDRIARAVANVNVTPITDSIKSGWSEIITRQQAVVDQINKTDLKPAADALRGAGAGLDKAASNTKAAGDKLGEKAEKGGKDIKEGATEGATELEDAGETVGGEIKEAAAAFVGVINSFGRGDKELSDAELAKKATNLRGDIAAREAAQYSGPQVFTGSTTTDMLLSAQRGNLVALERELALRSEVRRNAAFFGEERAFQMFGGTLQRFEDILRGVTEQQSLAREDSQNLSKLGDWVKRGATVIVANPRG